MAKMGNARSAAAESTLLLLALLRYRLWCAAPAFLADRLEHFLDRYTRPITSSGFFPFGPISTRNCLSSGLLSRKVFSQCEALRYSCEHIGWVYGFSERHKVKSCKAR